MEPISLKAETQGAAWLRITPERFVPKTPCEQEHTIPARYHGHGYDTNAPDRPLWREVLRAIRSPCRPNLFRHARNTWGLEYAAISDHRLATRVAETLLRHRADPGLRHFMQREAGLHGAD
jgi:hypothetical protein